MYKRQGSNDDTVTNNHASSSIVEIKNDKVGDVNTSEKISDNHKCDMMTINNQVKV